MNPIIKVEDLSKSYFISHQKQEQYVTFRDVVADNVKSFGRRITRVKGHNDRTENSRATQEEFWALKNITLEINEGERVGIIGRNGAGKTTLLKILSRITEPTKGKITIDGRVASLLEVGTGFHPELTGRENIFLNGAILGMSRSEIKRKFDEIVDFAEVEKFLDTPVKRYSSGMYVRLAFAVAAHLEPEILLVDEVLAVGDMQFQKKCLGRMEDFSTKEGRTVIFVSHNLAMISSLCEKCFLLEMGRVEKEGRTAEVVMHYYSSGVQSPQQVDFSTNGIPIGDEYAVLLAAEIRNEKGKITNEININESMSVVMKFQVKKTNKFVPNVHFFTGDGLYAFDSICPDAKLLKPGEYFSTCQIPANFLNDGIYFIGLAIASVDEGIILHFFEESALSINIKDPIEGTPGRNGYGGPIPGVVRPLLSWNINAV